MFSHFDPLFCVKIAGLAGIYSSFDLHSFINSRESLILPLLNVSTWLDSAKLGIWHIAEPESWFLERMELRAGEKAVFDNLRGKRRIEWLAGRWLVHVLTDSPKRIPCYVDGFGKPYLATGYPFMSISHSFQMVAVILSERPVGIDVQKTVSKITRLETKFLSDTEQAMLYPDERTGHLHVYWGAKEAIYKAYGRKKLEFRDNILVKPFLFLFPGLGEGHVRKNDFFQEYVLAFEKVGPYFLVAAMAWEEFSDIANQDYKLLK